MEVSGVAIELSVTSIVSASVDVAVKLVADYFFLGEMSRYFGRQDLMRSYLPSQFLHIVYIVVVGILGNLKKKYVWKGRAVR